MRRSAAAALRREPNSETWPQPLPRGAGAQAVAWSCPGASCPLRDSRRTGASCMSRTGTFSVPIDTRNPAMREPWTGGMRAAVLPPPRRRSSRPTGRLKTVPPAGVEPPSQLGRKEGQTQRLEHPRCYEPAPTPSRRQPGSYGSLESHENRPTTSDAVAWIPAQNWVSEVIQESVHVR